MKVVIEGFYGMGNLGDEAILEAFLQELKGCGEVEVRVLCEDPGRVWRIHRVKSLRSRGGRSFLRRIWAMKTSNLVVLGGGGLLKDYGGGPESLLGWLRLMRRAQDYGVKTATYAVGAENVRFAESREMLKRVLNNAELVSVRDRYSAEILQSVGVTTKIEVYSDPAVLLPDAPAMPLVEPRERVKVGVCLRHWFSRGHHVEDPVKNERLITALAGALDHLAVTHDAQVDFVPLRIRDPDNDVAMARCVARRMEKQSNVKIIGGVPDVRQFLEMLERYDLMLGMRLHSLILAAASGLPTVGIAYMPKVRAFMESMGQERYCFDPARICEADLIEALDETFAQFRRRSEITLEKVRVLRGLARTNVQRIAELAGGLEGGGN